MSDRDIRYWRHPTPYEIKFGYGAIHYIEFDVCFCWNDKTDAPKKWLIHDGLRYNLV